MSLYDIDTGEISSFKKTDDQERSKREHSRKSKPSHSRHSRTKTLTLSKKKTPHGKRSGQIHPKRRKSLSDLTSERGTGRQKEHLVSENSFPPSLPLLLKDEPLSVKFLAHIVKIDLANDLNSQSRFLQQIFPGGAHLEHKTSRQKPQQSLSMKKTVSALSTSVSSPFGYAFFFADLHYFPALRAGLLSYRCDFQFQFREMNEKLKLNGTKSAKGPKSTKSKSSVKISGGRILEEPSDSERDDAEDEIKHGKDPEQRYETPPQRRLPYSVKDVEIKMQNIFLYDLAIAMKEQQHCREFTDYFIGMIMINDEDIDRMMHKKLHVVLRILVSSDQRPFEVFGILKPYAGKIHDEKYSHLWLKNNISHAFFDKKEKPKG